MSDKYKLVSISPSERESKKYKAVFRKGDKTKTVHFGAYGMEDYTQHHDKERRERYRDRHKKDLRTDDPTRAGYLSYYILWGDSTDMKTNVYKYRRLFDL
jgi:hypothetical protein